MTTKKLYNKLMDKFREYNIPLVVNFVATANRYELRNPLNVVRGGLLNESGQSDSEHIKWLTSYIHYAEIYKQLVDYYNKYGQGQNQSGWFLNNIIYNIDCFNGNLFKLYHNDITFSIILNPNDPTIVDKLEGTITDYNTSIKIDLDKYNLQLNINGHDVYDFRLSFTCQIDNFKLNELPEKFKELIDTLKNKPDYI